MAFATRSSDSFNRTDGALGGSTLDNAAGGTEGSNTWTVIGGTWAVVSNQGQHSGTADTEMIVQSTSDVADQRVTITIPVAGNDHSQGPIARYASAGNYYLAHIEPGGAVQLFKRVGGSFTQLGSNGTSIVSGDELSVQCVGTAISLLINGVVDIGPITDSAHSTGKPGIYRGDATRLFDDFLYEVDVGGGGGSAIAVISSGYHQRGLR